MRIMKCFFICIVFALMLLSFSCSTTTVYHGQNTETAKIMYTGAIKEYKKSEAVAFDDIVINGKSKVYTAGFVKNLIYGEDTKYTEWEGTISLADASHKVNISCYKDYSENQLQMLKSIDIKGLSPIYSFSTFDIKSNNILGNSSVKESELPVTLSGFSIGGHEFSVLLTSMDIIPSIPNTACTYLSLVSADTQVFQITDEHGVVCAEFTKDYYKIFDTESEIDTKLLWSCIAAFSIIQDICAEDYPVGPVL